MKLLLDTHTLIWSVDEPSKVSAAGMAAMANTANERLLSWATIWEVAIKVGLGKLTLSQPYRPWVEQAVIDLKLTLLPITLDYAERQITLPLHHRDPFDRMLAAQALVDNLAVVSADAALDPYGVTRLW